MQVNDGLRVTDACCHAEQNGRVELFGKFKRLDGEVVSLLGIRRFEHQHLCGFCVVAVILLVLAGGESRIIGGNNDKTAVDARIGESEQRVSGDIQSDVFHRNDASCTAERDADTDFERDFFIRGPFRGSADFRECFENFSRRRSGISGAEPDGSGERRVCDSLISAEDSFLGHCNLLHKYELFAFINLQNLPQIRRFSSAFGQKKRFFVQIQNSARKNVQGKSPVLEIRKREMNGGNRGYLPDWYS